MMEYGMMFLQLSGSKDYLHLGIAGGHIQFTVSCFFTLGGTILHYYNHQKKLKLELYMDSLEMKKGREPSGSITLFHKYFS